MKTVVNKSTNSESKIYCYKCNGEDLVEEGEEICQWCRIAEEKQ